MITAAKVIVGTKMETFGNTYNGGTIGEDDGTR